MDSPYTFFFISEGFSCFMTIFRAELVNFYEPHLIKILRFPCCPPQYVFPLMPATVLRKPAASRESSLPQLYMVMPASLAR